MVYIPLFVSLLVVKMVSILNQIAYQNLHAIHVLSALVYRDLILTYVQENLK